MSADNKDKGAKPLETKAAAPAASEAAKTAVQQPAPQQPLAPPASRVDTGAATSPGELQAPAEAAEPAPKGAAPKPAEDSPIFAGAFQDEERRHADKTQKQLLRERMAEAAANEKAPERRGKRLSYTQLEDAAKAGKFVSFSSLLHPTPSNHVAPFLGIVTRQPRTVSLAGADPVTLRAIATDESLDVVIED